MTNSILVPSNSSPCNIEPQEENIQYFEVDNYFSELDNDTKKGVARQNLGVYSNQEVYSKQETNNKVSLEVGKSMREHLSQDDPHQILTKVSELLTSVVVTDGTTPFTSPQSGVSPLKREHLTTKGYVEDLLDNHLRSNDPHNIMDQVREELTQYQLSGNVYTKTEVYNKEQIDKINKNFIKQDGTTPFLFPQEGVTPIRDQHLTTKRYVDNKIFEHLVDADPHDFISILNKRLGSYYKMNEVYSKRETYSRSQIDSLVTDLVCQATKEALREHLNQFDPHKIIKEVESKGYVTKDGRTPFTLPQKGVDGVEDNDLATVGQINRAIDKIGNKVESSQPIWVTSGPIQTTVGFMEDNSSVPSKMSLQEVMDSIFYGKIIDVTSKSVVPIGTVSQVTMYIRGNALITSAELYQNDQLIGSFTREDFLEWEHTVNSLSIDKDTLFTFVVYYENGTISRATCLVKVAFGIFIGALPKFCKPGDLTYNCLLEWTEQDPINNIIYATYPKDVVVINHNFNFSNVREPKRITLVIPKDYNQLSYMHTASQHFGTDAFIIEDIPLIIPGIDKAVMYTVYMYEEPLYYLNSEVTFKLINNE